MATVADFTFEDTDMTVGAVVATQHGHVRDRFNNLLAYKPGDTVVQLPDDSLTVMTDLGDPPS